MEIGAERQKYFKALASQRARHIFRADGACNERSRLEEVPPLSSRPELASKLRPVSYTGSPADDWKLLIHLLRPGSRGIAELLRPDPLPRLTVREPKD
jgi:hypothetical protein